MVNTILQNARNIISQNARVLKVINSYSSLFLKV